MLGSAVNAAAGWQRGGLPSPPPAVTASCEIGCEERGRSRHPSPERLRGDSVAWPASAGAGYSPASASRSPRGLAACLPAPPEVRVDGSGDPVAELRERRELIRWAEGLYREVAKLEESRAALQRELEQCRDWRPDADGHFRPDRTAGENVELRKQLAAYAVEIEALRDERQSAANALHNANEERQRLAAERDELQKFVTSRSAGEVVLTFTVHNVDATRLRASEGVLSAFEVRLRHAIADETRVCDCLWVTAEFVHIELIESSVVQVEAVVTPPHGVGAEVLSSRLNASQSFARGVATSLETLREIESARDGPIGVHGIVVTYRDTQNLHRVRREHQVLKNSHGALLHAHNQLQSDHQELVQQHADERQRREDLEKRLDANQEELDVRLQQGHEQRQRDRQHIAMMHNLKESFATIIRELFSVLEELQEKYVAQTRHYEQLAQRVRSQQADHIQSVNEAEKDTRVQQEAIGVLREHLQCARKIADEKDADIVYIRQAAEEYEREARALYSKNHTVAEQVRLHQSQMSTLTAQEQQRLQRQVLEEQTKAERRKSRHRLFNNPNIAKHMARALEGVVVRKAVGVAPEKDGKLEMRKLRVALTTGPRGEPRFLLRWAKEPYKTWSEKSVCDLSRVIVLGFGHSSRIPGLYPQEKDMLPWRCLSVFTPRRSFDFLCRNDDDAQTLMLVLSRLCHRVQGWSLLGQIPSHGRFVAAQGWCKVETTCRSRRATLYTHLKDALHGAAEAGVAARRPLTLGTAATPASPLVPSTSGGVWRQAALSPASPPVPSASGDVVGRQAAWSPLSTGGGGSQLHSPTPQELAGTAGSATSSTGDW